MVESRKTRTPNFRKLRTRHRLLQRIIVFNVIIKDLYGPLRVVFRFRVYRVVIFYNGLWAFGIQGTVLGCSSVYLCRDCKDICSTCSDLTCAVAAIGRNSLTHHQACENAGLEVATTSSQRS